MSRLAKFQRRTRAEKGLFLEAAGQLLVVKLLLLAVPFRWIAPRLGSTARETPREPLAPDARRAASRVNWAVQAAARHLPLGLVCLPQAIAAKAMLRRRGIGTTLYLGLRRKDAPEFTAHAWLRAGDAILTGRRESHRHQAIASFGGEPCSFPPDFEALLALLRAALGQAPSAPILIENPSAFVRNVARHRIGAFLHGRLPADVRATLPETVREALARQAQTNARRALALTAELLTVADRLGAAAIPFVSVKGPLLARDLYGDPGLRHAGDLDLLIDFADLPRAAALLEAAGYRRTRPSIPLTNLQMRHYAEREFEFTGGPHGMRVELRWWLDGLGSLAEVGPTATHEEWHGRGIPVLAPSLNAIYLFQHGAVHGWRRLFWLLDVARLFERGNIDWADVRHQAGIRHIDRSALEAAALAEEMLGAKRPPALQTSEEPRVLARLTRNARRQIALPESELAGAQNFLREVGHRVLLQKTLAHKWAYLQPHFHSIRNWADLPLPDRLFWLYVPLAPFLWVRRRLCNSRRS